MEIRVNKNLLPPIIIIFIALIIGGMVLLSNKIQQKPKSSTQIQAEQQIAQSKTPIISTNARKLELAVPGMFCPGCKASVEGYLSSVPGIEYVEAKLTPRKSATVIYNPDIVTKEQIVKNQIFDTYGPATIISDEAFQGSLEQLNQTTINIPPSIQEKTNRVSKLLKQKTDAGANVQDNQLQLDKMDKLLQSQQYQEAESLLDQIITKLEQL